MRKCGEKKQKTCGLPVTPVMCVCQFNEWEPVTHQSGVLIVLSWRKGWALQCRINTHTRSFPWPGMNLCGVPAAPGEGRLERCDVFAFCSLKPDTNSRGFFRGVGFGRSGVLGKAQIRTKFLELKS